uniref:HARP domain-containing protein n=1 Tax=Bosea sp. NBC_00436 TaxID=2969620 RepID=A0A9E7ZXA9_9HYPH
MAGRERNDIEIRDDEEGPGAIVSFPFDAAAVERFREAFPRARWNDDLAAWRIPGTTAMLRTARWLDHELPSAFGLADQRGRDSFSFDPIVSRYLEVADEFVVRTPYSRTVVEELRAVPWAWWNGEDKAWHVPYRSVDELRRRWPVIEAAAERSEPDARRQRRDAAKSAPEYEDIKATEAERRRRRYPVPASELPPLDRVLMSHEGPLVVLEVTGEVVPAETAARHYTWSSGQPDDLVWALWRRPTHDELVKTWPARHPAAVSALLRGWWQPTLEELRIARRAARSLERAQETRRTSQSSRD